MPVSKIRVDNGNIKLYVPTDELRELYLNQQLSSTDMARMFDCSFQTVRKMLQEARIPMRSGSDAHKTQSYCAKFAPASLDINYAKKLYLDDKVTVRQAATRLEIPYTFLRKSFIRAGVPLRNKSEAMLPDRIARARRRRLEPERYRIFIERNKKAQQRRYADPQEREKTGAIMHQYHLDHPEFSARQAANLRQAKTDPVIMKKWARNNRLLWTLERRAETSERVKKMWQNPEVRSKLISKSKERWRRDGYAIARKLRLACCTSPNRPETAVLSVLESLFPNQWKFVGDGNLMIEGLNPDIVNVNGKKLIIEVFGDYWHTQVGKPYHINEGRSLVYAKYGYRTLIIWERETKDNTSLREKILEFVGH